MKRAREPACELERLYDSLQWHMCKDLAEVVMNCVAQRVPKDAYEPFEEDMAFFKEGYYSDPDARFQLKRVRCVPLSPCKRTRCAWHGPTALLDTITNEVLFKWRPAKFVFETASGYHALQSYQDIPRDCRSHPECLQYPEFNRDWCRHPVWYGRRSALFGLNGSHALHRYVQRMYDLIQ
jgi:hypothetical protein